MRAGSTGIFTTVMISSPFSSAYDALVHRHQYIGDGFPRPAMISPFPGIYICSEIITLFYRQATASGQPVHVALYNFVV